MKKNILVTLSLFILASCSSGYKKDNSQSQSQLDRPNRSISTTEDGQESIVSVPVRFNGYPLYAGNSSPDNHPWEVFETAREACKHFGQGNVYSYSVSQNMKGESFKVIGLDTRGSTEPNPQPRILEGKDIAIFTKLYCSSPLPEKPLQTGRDVVMKQSREVPLQVDGLPIFAGEVRREGSNILPKSSTQIAREACEYFGLKDVFSYEVDWSAENKRIVILRLDQEVFVPVKFKIEREGGVAVFKNLLCSI